MQLCQHEIELTLKSQESIRTGSFSKKFSRFGLKFKWNCYINCEVKIPRSRFEAKRIFEITLYLGTDKVSLEIQYHFKKVVFSNNADELFSSKRVSPFDCTVNQSVFCFQMKDQKSFLKRL